MKRIRKIVIIVLSSLLILFLAALIAGYVFLKNFNVAKYKPQIIQAVSSSLGRQVDFKDIRMNVSLWNGIRIKLSDLTISENPDFGAALFLGVKDVDAGINVLSFFRSGEISVPNVLISSPRINVVRNSSGVLNVQTLGQKTAKSSSAPSAAGLPAILISSFRVQDAGINFIDNSALPARELEVNNINLSVRNFSLLHPCDVSLDAAVLSKQSNFRLNGKMLFNILNSEVKFKDVEAGLDLGGVSSDELNVLFALAGQSAPERLAGKLKVKIKEGTFSEKGAVSLVTDVALSSGEVVFPGAVLGVPVEVNRLEISLEGFSLQPSIPFDLKVTASLYQDQTNVDLSVKGYVDTKSSLIRLSDGQFNTDLSLWPLDMIREKSDALKAVLLPKSLAGKFSLGIKDLSFSPAGLKTMLVEVKLASGEVVLDDIFPGISAALHKIDLALNDVSLDKGYKISFGVSAAMGYENDLTNLSLKGKGMIDLAALSLSLTQAELNSDLSRMPTTVIKNKVSVLKDVPLPDEIGGTASLVINELSVSAKGIGALQADFYLKDGMLRMKDVVPGVSFFASGIEAKVKNIGLDSLMDFDLGLGCFSKEKNLTASGKMFFSLSDQTVNVKESVLNMDLSGFDLTAVQSSIAALKDVPFPQSLGGKLSLNVKQAVTSASGMSSLDANGELSNWSVKFKELAVPVNGSSVAFNLTDKDFIPGTINATIGKGSVQADVTVNDYQKGQNFILSAAIKDVDLEEILAQEQFGVKVEGEVFGNIKAQGSAANLDSVAGNGNFEVKNARLKDLNVLKTVLDKISFLPGISQSLEEKLPDKYKNKLSDKDTVINKVSAPCVIAQSNIVLEPIAVEADEFVFSGKCQAGFDQKYALDGALKIPAELSSAMASSVSELQYMFDSDNNITIPVHVSGKGAEAPVVSVTQTALEMGKNALRNQAKNELGRVLGKVLGNKDGSGASGSSSEQSGAEDTGGSGSAEEVAGQILDIIFKKK